MVKELVVTVLAEDSVGYETPYLGQHGISLLVDAVTDTAGTPQRLRILMDVAQHPDPLLHNMELMNIDPATIDMVVLTHCHYDHTRGLVKVLEAIDRPGIPVVAHSDIFRPNFEISPRLRPIGVPPADGEARIEAAGAHLMLVRAPLQLAPGITTSGEVARTTSYEGANRGLFTLREGVPAPDPMMDDLSLYAEVEGRGVVILTGCSHAGIVNIVRHSRKVWADSSPGIAAVMGGLHLIVAEEDAIQSTVSGLREESVEQVLAGHCTGFRAQAALLREFGDRFQPLYTGLVVRWQDHGSS
ncbi:MAG: MBL fold metallo-hydrolase [Spirochaetaceae bacterium]|nr:MAG: MBL fold metallo-hydrolase [Spirochaetaceae bacterium]